MRKVIIFCLVVIILPVIAAQGNLFSSKNLIINLNISSQIEIIKLSPDSRISYLYANLSFFPQNDSQQEILKFESLPKPEKKDKQLIFKWDKPTSKILKFLVISEIKTSNVVKEVNTKIKFPLQHIPAKIKRYTLPSNTIDSDNEEIISLANQLAKGEDDLFMVVYKIGRWVKENVHYDLSTLTENIAQKASWVLKTKQGVCDEITTLFIALLRAIGIPAKFVSGVAYTNIGLRGFGPHGWAEVYFPHYGWIPFDITYGEFGFLDPTHIKLKEALDGTNPSISYLWSGYNIKVKTEKINVNAKLKDRFGNLNPKLMINVSILKDKVGFGSYNLVEVNIKNLMDYYIVPEITIKTPSELEVLNSTRTFVLLKPKETKKLHWIIKLTENLEKRFIYNFPIKVTSTDIYSTTNFISTVDYPIYDLNYIKDVLKDKHEEEEKVYSKEVIFNCSINKHRLYFYENATIHCFVKNMGNIYLKNISACVSTSCEKFNLGISEEKTLKFFIKPHSIGELEEKVSITNEDISKHIFIKFYALDKPKIEISELNHPKNVSYGMPYTISFLIDKKSYSIPKRVIITIAQETLKREWIIDELPISKRFKLTLSGKGLGFGKNRFKITIRYHDEEGNLYFTEKQFYITLINVPLHKKFIVLINTIIKLMGRIIS